MAVLAQNNLTLADRMNRLDPDGKEARIIEMLEQENEILMDATWMESNLPTGHQTTVRSGYSAPVFRKLNAGVVPTKSETAQVTEGIGMLEDYSSVDKDVAELNGNTSTFRLNEGRAKLEGMSQKMAETMFYGNDNATPESFLGFAPRFASKSGTTGQNIIDAGGTGSDNSSMWLVGWGDRSVSGIYPKGSRAGLMHEDLGLETVQDGTGIDGGLLRAYRDHYQWKAGIAVFNWQYIVRIANIDISAVAADPEAASVPLLELMLRATHTMKSLTGVKPVFYANRTIQGMLDIQAQNKGNLQLKVGNEEGNNKISLRGIPIRRVDALLENEAQVT